MNGQPEDAPRVTVVVVNYHSGELVGRAARSAASSIQAAGYSAEIIVVDNASRDGSRERIGSELPDAKVFANDRNVGFGAACNTAFRAARGQWWLLVNPDAEFQEHSVGELIEFIRRRPSCGVAAPSIDGPGSAESGGMLPSIRSIAAHLFAFNRLNWSNTSPLRGFQLRRGDRYPAQVEWVSAAAALLRPSAIRSVGGFDESIFMYGEDIDLCERLGAAGWEVWIVPAASASHTIAGTQEPTSIGWIDGLHRYYRERNSSIATRLFDLTLSSGLAAHALFALLTRRTTHQRRMARAARRAAHLAIAGDPDPEAVPA